MNIENSKIRFIVNPLSCHGTDIGKYIATIHSFFSQKGVDFDIQVTEARGQGTVIAKKSVAEDYGLVVAVGGDGTVNEVGKGLINTDVVFGIIPIGSANGIARGLNIPLKAELACETLFSGEVQQIDIGRMNNEYFLGVAGTGIDALVAQEFSRRRIFRGFLSYCLVFTQKFFSYKPDEVTVRIDNDYQRKLVPLVIAIANLKQYGYGAIIAPDADMNDSLFDISIIQHLNIFELIYHLPKLFNGNIKHVPKVESRRGNFIEIVSVKNLAVHIDGEGFFGGTKLRFSILPKALKVCTPSPG